MGTGCTLVHHHCHVCTLWYMLIMRVHWCHMSTLGEVGGPQGAFALLADLSQLQVVKLHDCGLSQEDHEVLSALRDTSGCTFRIDSLERLGLLL